MGFYGMVIAGRVQRLGIVHAVLEPNNRVSLLGCPERLDHNVVQPTIVVAAGRVSLTHADGFSIQRHREGRLAFIESPNRDTRRPLKN